MYKGFKTIAALCVTTSLFLSSVPFSRAAAPAEEKVVSGDDVLFEVEELRDQYTKVFRLRNGNNLAYISGSPLHYQEDDSWIDINNTLSEDTVEETYTNQANDFTVELPREMDGQTPVSISKDGYTVSFQLMGNPRASKGSVQERKAAKQKDNHKSIEQYTENINLQAGMQYEDIFADTDLQFQVNPEALKEEFVIRKKPKESVAYGYKVSCVGLTPSLQENGSILFYKENTEEILFAMPAPVMYDGAKAPAYSDDIAVSLRQAEDGYLLQLTPSFQWLTDKSRKYPVTVDPTVQAASSYYVDSYIDTAKPTENYGSQTAMYASETKTALLKFTRLPSIEPGRVVDACLRLHVAPTAPGKFGVVKNTEDWDESTVNGTYTGAQSRDYYDIQTLGLGMYKVDITEMVQDWYAEPDENYGLAFIQISGGETEFCTSEYSATSLRPSMTVEYSRLAGREEDNQLIQDIGRAGTASVNLFTGALSLDNPLMGFSGGGMPVNIVLRARTGLTSYGLPTGFSWNYTQYIYGSSSTYTYLDEEGLVQNITYDEEGGIWKDEEGNRFTSIALGTGREVTTADGFIYKYEASGGGFLKEIVNATQPVQSKVTINVEHSGRINSITDSLNRYYQFGYTTNTGSDVYTFLTGYGKDGVTETLTFSRGDLGGGQTYFKITYPDGYAVTYTQDSANRIVKVTDADGRYYTYGYLGDTKKVSRITEYGSDGSKGRDYGLSYDRSGTIYKEYDQQGNEIQGNTIIRKYNRKGEIVHVVDASYDPVTLSDQTGGTASRIASVTPRANVSALTLSFEGSGTYGFRTHQQSGSPLDIDTQFPGGHSGAYALKLTATDQSTFFYYGPYFGEIPAGTTYTFSLWIKTDPTVQIGMMMYDGSIWKNQGGVSSNGEWKKLSMTVTMAQKAEMSIQVVFMGTGVALLDDLQISCSAASARPYNFISDSGLYKSGSWGYYSGATRSSEFISLDGTPIKYAKLPAFSESSYIKQRVYLNGKKGQSYSMRVLAEAEHLLSDTGKENWDQKPFAGMVAEIPAGDLSDQPIYATASLADGIVGGAEGTYSVVSGEFVLPYDCAYVDIYLCSYMQPEIKFLCPELTLGEFYEDYMENYIDLDDMEASAQDAEAQTDAPTADTADDSQPERVPLPDGSGYTLTYVNDEKGLTSVYTYDNYGNLTSLVQDDGMEERCQTYTYSSDGAFLISSTDDTGKVTAYQYSNGRLTSATSGGKTQSYSYDSMGHIASLSYDGHITQYTYNRDRISQIIRDGNTYTYAYNPFGDPTSISLAGNMLLEYTYDGPGRQLSRVDYANGQYIEYEYDRFGNPVTVLENGEEIYKPVFDEFGNYRYTEDVASGRYSDSSFYEGSAWNSVYDADGNCMYTEHRQMTETGSMFTQTLCPGQNQYPSYSIFYPDTGNAAVTKMQFDIGLTSYSATHTIDSFGRVTNHTINLGGDIAGSPIVQQTYTYYNPFGNNTTSNFIRHAEFHYANMTSGSITDTYDYDYDPEGNIYSVTRNNVLQATYTYNPQTGKITRINDASQNKTFVYSYTDGVLTSIKVYPYASTGTEPGTLLDTIDCGQPDEDWNRMGAFDGKTIFYDEMGNVSGYDGGSLQWGVGRRLKNVTTQNLDNVSYTYDENGNRTTKTINGTRTEYFFRSDGKIVAEMTGGNTIFYQYRKDGTPFCMNYNGGTFFYLVNPQGDVTGILDAAGRLVASYTYDYWGNVLSIDGPSPDIARQNPLRYRGYYQDAETGYYYVNGDYYNPLWGDWLQGEDVTVQNRIMAANALLDTISEFHFDPDIYAFLKELYSHPDKVHDKGTICSLGMVFLVAKNYMTSANMWFHAFWGYGKPYKDIDMYEKAWNHIQNTVEDAVLDYARAHDNSRRWTKVFDIDSERPETKILGLSYYNFTEGDLHFSLGEVNLKTTLLYIPNAPDRRVYYHVTVSDTYDFTRLLIYEKLCKGSEIGFGDLANDFGYILMSENVGFIEEYTWSFNQAGSLLF